MSKTNQEFSFQSLLEQGAIIGQVDQWVEVFWGDVRFFESEADVDGAAIYRNDFFLQGKSPWLSYANHQRWTWSQWQEQLKTTDLGSHPDPSVAWEHPVRDDFEKTFGDIIDRIKEGSLLKAVPVVYERAAKKQFQLFSVLKSSPKNTYVYGSWQKGEGVFGYTPEILFELKDDQLSSMALAGTCAKEVYQKNPQQFLEDHKEQSEHHFVVDDLKDKLSTYGGLKLWPQECLELDKLVHLYTRIQVDLKQKVSFVEFIQSLHPTSALGVFPSEQIDLLKAWRAPWSLLGAPFGLRRSDSEYLCLVGIRNIQWDQDFLYLGSGCGLVEESQSDKEWQELSLKRSSVKYMLGL